MASMRQVPDLAEPWQLTATSTARKRIDAAEHLIQESAERYLQSSPTPLTEADYDEAARILTEVEAIYVRHGLSVSRPNEASAFAGGILGALRTRELRRRKAGCHR